MKLIITICILFNFNLFAQNKFEIAYCKLKKAGVYISNRIPKESRIALTAECPTFYNPIFSSLSLQNKELKYNFFPKSCIGLQRIRFNTDFPISQLSFYNNKINNFFTITTNIELDIDIRTEKSFSCVFDIKNKTINWLQP